MISMIKGLAGYTTHSSPQLCCANLLAFTGGRSFLPISNPTSIPFALGGPVSWAGPEAATRMAGTWRVEYTERW